MAKQAVLTEERLTLAQIEVMSGRVRARVDLDAPTPRHRRLVLVVSVRPPAWIAKIARLFGVRLAPHVDHWEHVKWL
jgi:hypothetical protein